jgi:preprotein translocase subunit Sec61beta
MAKRERIYMPAGFGGLVRYPEEGKEVLRLKPRHVVGIVIAIVIFELLLRLVLG